MTQPEKSRLTRLPSIPELEARAEEALDNESVNSTPTPGIIEIICPILERHMVQYNRKGTAKIHLIGKDVVCEMYLVSDYEHDVGEGKDTEKARDGCCVLRSRTKEVNYSTISYYDHCPYKKLHDEV